MRVPLTVLRPALILVGLPALLAGEAIRWQGGAPGSPGDWNTPGNWSGGRIPAADAAEDVLVPGGRQHYPVLNADASVGGSLRLAAGARLTLNGRRLSVGTGLQDTVDGPDLRYSRRTPRGLVIEKDAQLDALKGAPEILIRLGGLVNEGKAFGAPALRFEGVFHGFDLQPGGLQVAKLCLGPAVYPYPVTLSGNLAVTGGVELEGGDLVVSSGTVLEVRRDLRFTGTEPGASLTPHGNVNVHGTIRSEGASRYVNGSSGWVSLVGAGDQELVTGGILPPIRLAKKLGKVVLSGSLHCAGLYLEPGNVLELAKGQSLVFGVPFREWKIDPKSIIVIRAARPLIPTRGWRGLLNRGAIVGKTAVPFTFYVPEGETTYQVRGDYSFKRKQAKGAGAGLAPANPYAGDLSVGGPGCRLEIKGEELLLDGQPAAKIGATGPKGPDEALGEDEEELDDFDEDEGPLDEMTGPAEVEERAKIRNLVISKLSPPQDDKRVLVNVAPQVARILSYPSVGVDVYNLVDGSPSTGAGFRGGVTLNGTYQFDFAVPVTVSAVRFLQGRLWSTRYVVCGDTTNDGACETVLTYGSGGAPNAWRSLSFAPERVHRLKFRSLGGQCGWETSSPQMREFEIYADKESLARVREATPVPSPQPVAKDLGRLAAGDVVKVDWPEPRPEDRVLKLITTDLWMLGIHREESLPKTPLREHAQCLEVIREIKGLGADGMLLFIEAEMKAFWPSTNFESLTNERFFAERRARALPQVKESPVDLLKKDPEDDNEDLEEKGPLEEAEAEAAGEMKDGEESPALSIAPQSVDELPNQRDLLRELCDTMHENGLKVFFIVLGRFFESYLGPKDRDAFELLIGETVSRGLDGFSLTTDEATLGMFHPPKKESPDYESTRKAFKERFGPEAELPPSIWVRTVDYRRWVLFGYERIAKRLKRYRDQVKEINPDCATFTNLASSGVSANNRMTYGACYDVIGHLADPDYLGTDYQEREQRIWTGAARNRRGCMELFVPRSVREGVQCVLQGARLVSYYRYNYLEMQKSRDHRQREFAFMKAMARWGATRPMRAKIALVLSRASEDWWDHAHGTNWLGWNPVAKQGFWTHRAINALLLDNGYPFDLYYLDWLESVRNLHEYKLILLPFPYSITARAAGILEQARTRGSKILIAQKRGAVDEVGKEHPAPLLQDLIAKGEQDGSVVYLDRNLVEYETERGFTDEMKKLIDGLLGGQKPLFLDRHGHNVVAHVSAASSTEQYLALINWRDEEAEIEVGLNLADGTYKMLSLSSISPTAERQGLLDGKAQVTGEALKRFAVTLSAKEARLLYVRPSSAAWASPRGAPGLRTPDARHLPVEE